MTILNPSWRLPPADMSPPTQGIHVWCTALERPAAQLDRFVRLLSPDEHARAGRFHFERDRRRFIVGRGALRMILSRYLQVDPERLRFGYSARGKPYLLPELNWCALQFSLAHSNELVVYAFVCKSAVGIDLEYVHPLADAEQLAARFFAPGEVAALQALPDDQKLAAFFNCWTRKEAYIKARGDGLAYPVDHFQVSLAPGEPARLLKIEGSAEEAARWFMAAFMPDPAYIAALAVEGCASDLEFWRC